MAVNQNPRFVAGPPTPCYKPLCRGLLLHTLVANAWCRYALQKNLVANVLVASQEILLETYVADWPPKPVTNPMFLIHSHICIYTGICGGYKRYYGGPPERFYTVILRSSHLHSRFGVKGFELKPRKLVRPS